MRGLICSLVLVALLGISQGAYNYRQALKKSILFYAAQRSGRLPSNNPIPWRGNSGLGDKGNSGEDLTGGWYDAGDHVKFGFPMAWSATTLIWGILDFGKGYGGDRAAAKSSVKWALDYFLKAHVSNTVLYGQVGDGNADHAFWGRPEDMKMKRPAFKITASKPGSDLAGETAAALAAGYLLFKDSDHNYAQKLLSHSKTLFNFAFDHRGIYSKSISNADNFYHSSAYQDELCWAGLWLYRATNDKTFLNKAMQFKPKGTPWAFSWDTKEAGSLVLMTKFNVKGAKAQLESFLKSWFPGGGIHYTPKGLAWRNEWGSLRYSSNSAFIALQAAKLGVLKSQSISFAKRQINYALGSSGRSYVVGFGNNPPKHCHHRAASCPDKPKSCGSAQLNTKSSNPHVLNGALVGGPGKNDDYNDVRTNYQQNEVACDYNAGFQGALAGILQL